MRGRPSNGHDASTLRSPDGAARSKATHYHRSQPSRQAPLDCMTLARGPASRYCASTPGCDYVGKSRLFPTPTADVAANIPLARAESQPHRPTHIDTATGKRERRFRKRFTSRPNSIPPESIAPTTPIPPDASCERASRPKRCRSRSGKIAVIIETKTIDEKVTGKASTHTFFRFHMIKKVREEGSLCVQRPFRDGVPRKNVTKKTFMRASPGQ